MIYCSETGHCFYLLVLLHCIAILFSCKCVEHSETFKSFNQICRSANARLCLKPVGGVVTTY